MELWQMGLTDLARRIRAREISVSEVTRHHLDRAALLGPELKCIASISPEVVLTAAAEADRALASGMEPGPLFGVPLGVKDICNLAGTVTGNGSHLSDDDPLKQTDSVVASKLRSAGALILAKTETHEFAIGGPDPELPTGPARNPWRLANYPGGSSSGSGAAVAAGIVPGAIGTDTGGSIRIPSGYCGLVGMKPTYGRVSRRGISPLAYSLDHAGPMTWRLDDNIAMLQAIAGHDPLDPASARVSVPDYASASSGGVSGLRVGVLRGWIEELGPRLSDDVAGSVDLAARALDEAGASVHSCALSQIGEYIAVNRIILLAEGYAIHEADLRDRPEKFGRFTRERLAVGSLLSAADYVQALRRRAELVAEISEAFSRFDVLLWLSGVSNAPEVAGLEPADMLRGCNVTSPFNVTGNPVLSMPLGLSPSGLPRSVQIIAAPFAEATAYRAGRVLEPFAERDRRPEIAYQSVAA